MPSSLLQVRLENSFHGESELRVFCGFYSLPHCHPLHWDSFLRLSDRGTEKSETMLRQEEGARLPARSRSGDRSRQSWETVFEGVRQGSDFLLSFGAKGQGGISSFSEGTSMLKEGRDRCLLKKRLRLSFPSGIPHPSPPLSPPPHPKKNCIHHAHVSTHECT